MEPAPARVAAVVSLTSWLGVTVAGRLLAYTSAALVTLLARSALVRCLAPTSFSNDQMKFPSALPPQGTP